VSFLPCLAEIRGPENRWTDMSGANRGEQRFLVAGIEHDMVHNVAEKYRIAKLKLPSRLVTIENPRAFARADQDCRFSQRFSSYFSTTPPA
jgi:hypothetical protein